MDSWVLDAGRSALDDETPEADVGQIGWLLAHPDGLRAGERRAMLAEAAADLESYLDPGWLDAARS